MAGIAGTGRELAMRRFDLGCGVRVGGGAVGEGPGFGGADHLGRGRAVGRVGEGYRGGARQSKSGVREFGAESDAEVADEVGVAAPGHGGDGAAAGGVGAVVHVGAGGGAEAEAVFLDAAVAYEGAEDEGVGDGGGGEDFQGGEEAAELLVGVAVGGGGYAVDGYDDEDGGEGEEEDEGDFTDAGRGWVSL